MFWQSLDPDQFGFLEDKSTLTQLMNCYNVQRLDLETNQHLLMLPLYYFYNKPFDSVPHQHLLLKSKGYGIEGGLLQWFRNFLTIRQQHVFVRST